MFKQEFEKLAGYRVTDSDYYRIIEPMYMATDLNKADFVACLDRKRFALPTEAEALKALKKMAKEFAEEEEPIEHWEKLDRLGDKAADFAQEFYNINRLSASEWCYIAERTSRTSGRVLSVVFEFGKFDGFTSTIELYKRPNVSAYEALTY